jgi:predicted GIY-YIG superfamily endonuclease
MAAFYILESLSRGKFGLGATENLERRLSEHGRVPAVAASAAVRCYQV